MLMLGRMLRMRRVSLQHCHCYSRRHEDVGFRMMHIGLATRTQRRLDDADERRDQGQDRDPPASISILPDHHGRPW